MVDSKFKQLAIARAKVTKLEQAVAAVRNRELAALPARYGFDDLKAFISAVKAAGGRKGKRSTEKKRKRAVITDATRAAVKKEAEDGKTGAAIAKSLGISLPTVQNIKKALGLVKARR